MKRIVSILFLFLLALSPLAVFAQGGLVEGVQSGVDKVGSPLGFGEQSPTLIEVVGIIISILLSLVGIALFLIFLYAGFTWMTAQGDKGKVETARKMITNAVIGLVIVFASYAIADFVLEKLAGNVSGAPVDVSE